MPVFVNEVVIRASVDRPRAASVQPTAQAVPPWDRETLRTEVKEALQDYLERELDRIGER